MRLVLYEGCSFGKMWKNMEKRPFFLGGHGRLEKYCTGGYGRIGVYRVYYDVTNVDDLLQFPKVALPPI